MFWAWAIVATLGGTGAFCITVACVTSVRLRAIEADEKRCALDHKQSMHLLKDNSP